MEAHIHNQLLSLFVWALNLDWAKEKGLIVRQLAIKCSSSHSWVQTVRNVLEIYDLHSAYSLVLDTSSKNSWRETVKSHVITYWKLRLQRECAQKKTLKYLNYESFTCGKLHTIWSTTSTNHWDIKKACLKAKIAIGRYTLQTDKYRGEDPTCKICGNEQEDLHHFPLECTQLENKRYPYIMHLKKTLLDFLDVETSELIVRSPNSISGGLLGFACA